MHQSRKEKYGIHLTVTRLTLRDLIEKQTNVWHCRYLPHSYKIFYKILQQNDLSGSRSRLNPSPSMRFEVEFKSSGTFQVQMNPKTRRGCLSWSTGAAGRCWTWTGPRQVGKEIVTFALLSLSCAKCSSAAVSNHPETVSNSAAWGPPLQKP